jgi:gamma-D-glutamyl-L-lysine dipeptidyl-peptidase
MGSILVLTKRRMIGLLTLLFLLVLGMVIHYHSLQPPTAAVTGEVVTRIQETQAQYAPDLRTTIFAVDHHFNGSRLTLEGTVLTVEQKQALTQAVRSVPGVSRVNNQVKVLPDLEGGRSTGLAVSSIIANIYAGDGVGSDIVSQAVLGEPLRRLRQSGGLSLVQMENQYIGWVLDRDITDLEDEEESPYLERLNTQVTASLAPVHLLPENTSPVLLNATAPSRLQAVEESSGWLQVILPDGRRGWVQKVFTQPMRYPLAAIGSDQTIVGEPGQIVDIARSYLGTSYYWGGTTPLGIDCSGFTQMVYQLAGVILPRDADQQYLVGLPVTIDDLVPGDLIFFSDASNSPVPNGKPSHVGICLGQEQYIHAGKATGKVSINSLDPTSKTYQAKLAGQVIGARRIITRQ